VTQMSKIASIVNLKSDIICLCDLRLSNKANVNSGKKIEHLFSTHPTEQYNFQYNSTMNKRGTGRLIKKCLDITVEERRCDVAENYLLLRLTYQGSKYIIGSIYGPNEYDPNFFTNLADDITSLGNHPILLSGDWNCTFSTEPVASNIDCLHMVNAPNLRHSNILANLCENFDLTDLFRTIYPDKKEFTFVPRCNLQKNRSRIDFFIVSRNLLLLNYESKISSSIIQGSVDHKPMYSSQFHKTLP
jgi:exonuclease III